MNVPTYLAQLAQQLGCTYVPKCTTFKDDTTSNQKGAVIGVRKGYLVALALTRAGRNASFAIMVRFPTAAAVPQLQEAIKSKPGFSSFFKKKWVKFADNNRLTVSWIYAMTKPKLEEVVALLDTLVDEVSRYAPAFNGKCEDCGSTETRETTLMNGVPGYHCAACQMRIAADKRREAEEYQAKDANYAAGIMAGIVAAAVAGTAWGEVVAWIEIDSGKWYPYLHAAVTFLIGMFVCWALFKAMGKRDRAGQVAAVLLTLAGKWWGDALYYSHFWAHLRGIPFSAALVTNTLKHFFVFKFASGLHVVVFLCDLGFSAMMPWTPWGRLPKFEPVFQTINPDGSLTQTLARGVGA
jgi:hypothetical protein